MIVNEKKNRGFGKKDGENWIRKECRDIKFSAEVKTISARNYRKRQDSLGRKRGHENGTEIQLGVEDKTCKYYKSAGGAENIRACVREMLQNR